MRINRSKGIGALDPITHLSGWNTGTGAASLTFARALDQCDRVTVHTIITIGPLRADFAPSNSRHRDT